MMFPRQHAPARRPHPGRLHGPRVVEMAMGDGRWMVHVFEGACITHRQKASIPCEKRSLRTTVYWRNLTSPPECRPSGTSPIRSAGDDLTAVSLQRLCVSRVVYGGSCVVSVGGFHWWWRSACLGGFASGGLPRGVCLGASSRGSSLDNGGLR
jgi:hypothetical protein